MKKMLLLLALISVTALIAHAETSDSDIIDSTGNVVGHIHYNDPSPPLPPSYFETHNLEYWMDYYSRATFQAGMVRAALGLCPLLLAVGHDRLSLTMRRKLAELFVLT